MSYFGGKADITDKPHVIDGDTIEILKNRLCCEKCNFSAEIT